MFLDSLTIGQKEAIVFVLLAIIVVLMYIAFHQDKKPNRSK